jgi:hypothetical protein
MLAVQHDPFAAGDRARLAHRPSGTRLLGSPAAESLMRTVLPEPRDVPGEASLDVGDIEEREARVDELGLEREKPVLDERDRRWAGSSRSG